MTVDRVSANSLSRNCHWFNGSCLHRVCRSGKLRQGKQRLSHLRRRDLVASRMFSKKVSQYRQSTISNSRTNIKSIAINHMTTRKSLETWAMEYKFILNCIKCLQIYNTSKAFCGCEKKKEICEEKKDRSTHALSKTGQASARARSTWVGGTRCASDCARQWNAFLSLKIRHAYFSKSAL